MDTELGSPVGCLMFSKKLKDNPSGNMLLVQNILPVRLGALPYQHGHRQQVVIVSRFASFLDKFPDAA